MSLMKETNEKKFLEIACPRCQKPHTIFSKSTLKIKCVNCNKLLIKTTGGKTKVKAPIKKVLC